MSYAKCPQARAAQLKSDPKVAHVVAQADATRKAIYDWLDAPGQGAAPRELNQRYGALLNVEKEATRRKIVAERQAPENLTQQMSKLGAAAKFGSAAFKGATGRPFQAMGEMAEGVAMGRAANFLREMNSTDSLIARTFQYYEGKPTPVQMPPKFVPKGLLTEGSIKTPPPADRSKMTVTTGPPLQPKIKGLLPAPALVTPPPADLSGMAIVDAARGIARDPKTGRMFRYYKATQK